MTVQTVNERQLTCVHSLWCYIFVVCAYSTLASCQSSTLSVVCVWARVRACVSVFRPPFLCRASLRETLSYAKGELWLVVWTGDSADTIRGFCSLLPMTVRIPFYLHQARVTGFGLSTSLLSRCCFLSAFSFLFKVLSTDQSESVKKLLTWYQSDD